MPVLGSQPASEVCKGQVCKGSKSLGSECDLKHAYPLGWLSCQIWSLQVRRYEAYVWVPQNSPLEPLSRVVEGVVDPVEKLPVTQFGRRGKFGRSVSYHESIPGTLPHRFLGLDRPYKPYMPNLVAAGQTVCEYVWILSNNQENSQLQLTDHATHLTVRLS